MSRNNAVITGSTSGIGLGIAEKFAANGYNIMINGFGDPKLIEELRQNLSTKHNVKVIFSDADMTKPEEIKAMIAQAEKELGSIDVLINNAGIQFTTLIENFPDDKWDAIIATNLSASFHTIKAAIVGMQKRNFGRIINIASTHGLVASPTKSAYVSAKHGILGLTKVVAIENAVHEITCNAICPGYVLTPLVQKQLDDKAKAENKSIEQATADFLRANHPSLRFVEIDEVAEMALFLAKPVIRNVTGSMMVMDGGWTAR